MTQPAIEFPSDREILMRREFDAPIDLVFDVFTKTEHLRRTFAPFDEEMTVCDSDLRVGGDYHYVMVTPDGTECSFRGRFLAVEPPTRTVQTWIFDGWPGVEAVESMELSRAGDGTAMTYRLAFQDEAGRARMSKYDGLEASFENVANYLRTLQSGTAE